MQENPCANARARANRCGETNAIQSVIDGHAHIAELDGIMKEFGNQRKGKKAVRDGPSILRLALRALGVDVNLLMVVRDLRELVDAFLRDLQPIRHGDLAARELL
jgi:hypothetical protein